MLVNNLRINNNYNQIMRLLWEMSLCVTQILKTSKKLHHELPMKHKQPLKSKHLIKFFKC